MIFSEIFVVSSMAVPRSSLSSILRLIRSNLCTSDLLLQLTLYVWLRLESATVEVLDSASVRRSAANPAFVFVGKSSDVYNKCLQEVQTISCATLFAPVLRVEAVQAMSTSFSFARILFAKRDLI
jgi:hypothetical protein